MGSRVRRVRQTERARAADDEAALEVAHADWRREALHRQGRDVYPDVLPGLRRRGDQRKLVRV
jgi:hypothetical protein